MPASLFVVALISCSDNPVTAIDDCARSPATNTPDCTLRTQIELSPFGLRGSIIEVNDAGEILGSPRDDDLTGEYIVWSKSGVRKLSLPPGMSSAGPFDINNHGHVAGVARNAIAVHAVMWDERGVPRVLASGATPNSGPQATAINDRGDVAGVILVPNGIQHGFFRSAAGELVNIESGYHVEVWAVNNLGQVVGTTRTQRGNQRAFVWSRQTGLQILPLAGPDEGQASSASALNDDGWIVGTEYRRDAYLAVLWRPGQAAETLPIFPDLPFMYPIDINDAGEVLGTASSNTKRRAFMWSRVDGLYDVAPGMTQTTLGSGLNNRGDAIGSQRGSSPTGPHTGHYVWTRTPSRYQ